MVLLFILITNNINLINMKNLLLILLISLTACNQTFENKNEADLKFPYEPTYQKEWKTGSQENILIVQNLHKDIMDGNFKKAYSHFSEDVTVWHGDGTTTEGLADFKKLYDPVFKSANIRDYSVGVNISVVSEEGHEWVLLWDTASMDGVNGEETHDYMESIRIENGKIIAMNQFTKPVKD
jgi:hypothetical protein